MDEQETRCALSALRNAPGAAPCTCARTWPTRGPGVGKEIIGLAVLSCCDLRLVRAGSLEANLYEDFRQFCVADQEPSKINEFSKAPAQDPIESSI